MCSHWALQTALTYKHTCAFASWFGAKDAVRRSPAAVKFRLIMLRRRLVALMGMCEPLMTTVAEPNGCLENSAPRARPVPSLCVVA